MQPIEIVVGRGGPYDPVAGTSQCPVPVIAGQGVYIEKAGYGTYDYDKWGLLSLGGFQLLGGILFQAGERFYIHLTGVSYGTGQTSYTNGFNYSQVISALYGRIGWRQPTISGSPVLTSINTMAKGNRVYQDFHALATISNLKSVMEEVAASDSSLNTYLESLQRGIIMRCLNGVFDNPEYIDQRLLFKRSLVVNDQLIENKGQFVGIRINVLPAPDLAVQVDSISLYFDSAITFNLYVFNDSIKAPLAVISVTTVANSQTVIGLSDIVLNYISSNNQGGAFYIGYFQSDIGSAKAYWEQGCSSSGACYGWDYFESNKLAGYDWERNQVRYSGYTFGMNLHVSVFRDHTWQIVRKAALFDNVIGLQMAAQIVEQILYNTRSNSTERILKDNISAAGAQLDLNGVAAISDSPHTTGLKKQIDKELQRMKLSFFPKAKAITVNIC
ncbi:MAG TPA: hypothetical protein VMZ03_03850 [Chitinophagaceae bacterium]|nr:hypothetical protein [Chitinophagaceae bacterium]